MNTIIGIGTVFVMLIFLIFVISSFDYILGDKKKKKHRQHLYRKHRRLSQHRLLKRQYRKQTIWSCEAVITAAIAMYEEDMASASGDAYVARPIRRKGKRA